MLKNKSIDYIYRWETDLYYTSLNEVVPKILKKRFIRRLFPKFIIPYVKKAIAYLGIKNDINNLW